MCWTVIIRGIPNPDCADPGESEMLLSDAAKKESDESMDLYQAEQPGTTGGDAWGIGIHSLPLVKSSSTAMYFANLRSVDLRQLEAEDKLGCARGVLWAIVFEAALGFAGVLYWKFHFLQR
jgi:hypothetical protein